jgi:putative PIN family toxin of toxin-antitoxin system
VPHARSVGPEASVEAVIAVFDSNVFVSAVVTPRGTADQLIQVARDHRVDLVISGLLLAELRDVLGRRKLRRFLSESEADEYVTALTGVARMMPDPPPGGALVRDPDDDYLVRLALSVRADLLVSGDKDLLEADLAELPVVTPREALDRLSR